MKMDIKLKPCPFCGGEAQLLLVEVNEPFTFTDLYYTVSCIKCKTSRGAYHISKLPQFCDAEAKEARKQAIEAWNSRANIEQLPSAQPSADNWIPVTKGFPNAQTEVIVSCLDDSGDTRYRYTASGWVTTNKEYWIVDNEINPFVIAWMPLPEPYKGGE